MTEEATNLAADDNTDLSTVADEAEVETDDQTEDEQQFDEDGNPIEPEPAEEDENAEIEHEGQRYKVPKALEKSFMMHADYTQKTQALAAERRSIHEQYSRAQQVGQAEINALATVGALDQALAEYGQIDWQTWNMQNPQAAQAAWMQFSNLKEQRAAAVQQHAQARIARESENVGLRRQRIQQAYEVLARDIPDWPTKAPAILEGGIREYGFDRSEIEDFEDARMVKVLNDALAWREHQAKTGKAQANLKAQQVRPIPRAKSTGAPQRGLSDKMSAEDWVRQRNEQVRKKARP